AVGRGPAHGRSQRPADAGRLRANPQAPPAPARSARAGLAPVPRPRRGPPARRPGTLGRLGPRGAPMSRAALLLPLVACAGQSLQQAAPASKEMAMEEAEEGGNPTGGSGARARRAERGNAVAMDASM
ncbi:MAG: hypothetical protein ACK559_24130, partial [bacterium]